MLGHNTLLYHCCAYFTTSLVIWVKNHSSAHPIHVIIDRMNIAALSGTLASVGALIAIGLFSLPSVVSVLRNNFVRGLLAYVALGLFAIGFQILAVKSGMPFGKFSYGDGFGTKVLGAAPWTVGLAFPSLLFGSFWLAKKFGSGLAIILTPVITTITAVVLTPALVRLDFIKLGSKGPLLGIPILHFAGWIIYSFLGALILSALWGGKTARRGTAYSAFSMLLFWSGVNLGINLWVPAGVGLALCTVMLIFFVIEKKNAQLDT